MFKSKLATFVGAFIIAGSAFAMQDEACPDINLIKAEGLSMAEQVGPDLYVTYHISNYETEHTWGFIVAPVEGDSDDTALESGNEILSNMSAQGTPEEQDGAIICDYPTGRQDVVSAAIREPGQISPLRLKQLIKNRH